jgi:glyoxylase-like metal-dependent hydrolase (beta-lactamase superfamily II)
MKRNLLAVAIMAWLINSGAAAPEKMTMFKVTEDVYFMENSRGSGNSTFVVTNDGVVVLDFHIANADQTLAAIRQVTDKKVRYLLTSHSAGDHASGAWHFREDKPIYIATKNQAKDLLMQEGREFEERRDSADPRNAAYKGKHQILPDITFDGTLTFYLGGLTFQLTAEGKGHSTGDLTVYIPQRRVMLMGDLLNIEIHPGQGESAGVFYSYVKGWIQILDKIMARNLPVDTYVPGHGPVHIGRGIKDLEEQKRYFVVMRDEVAKIIQAGKNLKEIEKDFRVPQEFAHYKRPERLKDFLKLFYHQLLETGYVAAE